MNKDRVVQELLEVLQFGGSLKWTHPQETRVISAKQIDTLLAEDKDRMLVLIKKVCEGDNADGYLFNEFDTIAGGLIREALDDYDCMPEEEA